MRRSKRIRMKITAVLAAIAAALIIGELFMRVAGIRTNMPVNAFQMSSAVAGSLDRAPADVQTAPANIVRIAFLGDSFTYGLGVRPDQTFVYKSGQRLNSLQRRPCFTMNLGRAGEDLIREWGVYDAVKTIYRPHVVVQVISPNDLDVDLYKGMVPVQEVLAGQSWPARSLKLVALVENKLRFAKAYRMGLDYARGGATPQEQERSWRIVSFALGETKRLVEQSGAIHVLVHFPFVFDLADYPLKEVHRRMAALAQQLGVPYLDLLDAFRGQDGRRMCLPGDTHPSAPAHELAAEAIAAFLDQKVLPKVPATASTQPATQQTPEQSRRAAIQYFNRVLALDPTCQSARISLDSMQKP